MKEVMNIGIGGKSFVVETSAYEILRDYLELFSSKIKPGESSEVMEDIESRIAELCSENISAYKNVVTESIVVKIVTQLGLPNGESYRPFQGAASGAAKGAASTSAGAATGASTGTSAFFHKIQRKQRLFRGGLTIPDSQCISRLFLLTRYLYCTQNTRPTKRCSLSKSTL